MLSSLYNSNKFALCANYFLLTLEERRDKLQWLRTKNVRTLTRRLGKETLLFQVVLVGRAWKLRSILLKGGAVAGRRGRSSWALKGTRRWGIVEERLGRSRWELKGISKWVARVGSVL